MEVINGDGKSSNSQMPPLPPGTIKKVVAGLIVVLIVLAGITMFYTVEEQEHAAILTFGKYTDTVVESGLHFKAPYPIQQVVKLPAKRTQQIYIGYDVINGQTVAKEEEALMITGDENIVSADAVVEWRISNVRDYLYNIENPEEFLKNSAIASIRSVMGSTNLDFAITEGKTQIQSDVYEKLIKLQEVYATGIQVMDIKFQDIEPPEGEVQAAFKAVTDAREEKNTKINNAQEYMNDRLPKARGEAQALIENAEAEKKSRVLNAQGDVEKFNAIYTEYAKSPTITENRLVIETLEKILPNAKVVVTDDSGDTVKYLPLNELTNSKSTNKSSQGGEGQ
ncbi:FtsH protease activity modulator HflK [Chengkuizengella sediminis]|uniref:FtsH protease activity modulator HflK n=1 Tax=Chengkuizengella sediminis TaxID=1885917 RepID=UPI001389F029|nr:FtsH protease activity modulator HflK [Chengkuizengella sediminis]NDI34833.1 FtsH protease activity modulator HflK [Chengkuizengella sediminis]